MRRGGGGDGTQNFVYKKWPDKMFPIVNFVFSHDGHFGPGGVRGGDPPPPMVYGHSNTSLAVSPGVGEKMFETPSPPSGLIRQAGGGSVGGKRSKKIVL